MKTKEKILLGAKNYLLKNGQEGFTVRAIAAEAGVNQGLVHHYFGAKENLIFELIDYVATAPFEEIKNHIVGKSKEEVKDLILDIFLTNSDLVNLIIEFVAFARRSDRIRVKMRGIMLERRDFLASFLGITDLEDKITLSSGVFGIIFISRIDETVSIEKAIVQLFNRFNLL